jgi:glycosyltransferase involved in cell wall biosynthesis
MRVYVLDPALIYVRGHQHDWDTRIANHLAELGHDVGFYANVKAKPDAVLGFDKRVRVERLFRHDPLAAPEWFDPICGEIERQLRGAQSIAADLSKLPPADIWLWPTAFSFHLRGCAAVDTNAKISACLQLPPDTGFGLPFAEPGPWWRFSAKQLSRANGRVRTVGTLEPECLAAFQHYLGDLDPILLPIPYDGTPSRRTELKTVGFVGGRRFEQGIHLIGGTIARCIESGLKVLTQSDEYVPAHLKRHQDLTVLDHRGDFAAKVERCDLVIAPYRWSEYTGGRGSGVVYQAIASGVPCVAPYASSPGRTLSRIGSGSLFNEFNSAGIVKAIENARSNYPSLAEAAYRGALEWREHNGLEKFVDAMINGTKHQVH